jgi:hypothetical protein
MEQNNRPLGWTTLEESKQLVEAGLPVETADMYQAPDAGTVVPTPYITKTDDETLIPAYKGAIPCWSLGALTQRLPRTIEQEYNLLINSEFYVMYRHPFSKDVKFVCSKSSFLIENVKDAIIWLLKNKLI